MTIEDDTLWDIAYTVYWFDMCGFLVCVWKTTSGILTGKPSTTFEYGTATNEFDGLKIHPGRHYWKDNFASNYVLFVLQTNNWTGCQFNNILKTYQDIRIRKNCTASCAYCHCLTGFTDVQNPFVLRTTTCSTSGEIVSGCSISHRWPLHFSASFFTFLCFYALTRKNNSTDTIYYTLIQKIDPTLPVILNPGAVVVQGLYDIDEYYKTTRGSSGGELVIIAWVLFFFSLLYFEFLVMYLFSLFALCSYFIILLGVCVLINAVQSAADILFLFTSTGFKPILAFFTLPQRAMSPRHA